jgi:antitoxin VapB
MSKFAKLFKNGRSQAVRLPQEFRFAGDCVRIRKVGRAVILEPMTSDVQSWFAELDKFDAEPFMQEGRDQPQMPIREMFP